MKKWLGIGNGSSDVGGEEPLDATGVSYFVDGEIHRRPGLTQLAASGGVALGAFRSPLNGAWLLIVKANGDIVSVAIT